jgi:hypothetical protein
VAVARGNDETPPVVTTPPAGFLALAWLSEPRRGVSGGLTPHLVFVLQHVTRLARRARHEVTVDPVRDVNGLVA